MQTPSVSPTLTPTLTHFSSAPFTPVQTPTVYPSPDNQVSSKHSNSNIGAIVGGVIAAVVLIGLGVVLCLRRRYRYSTLVPGRPTSPFLDSPDDIPRESKMVIPLSGSIASPITEHNSSLTPLILSRHYHLRLEYNIRFGDAARYRRINQLFHPYTSNTQHKRPQWREARRFGCCASYASGFIRD